MIYFDLFNKLVSCEREVLQIFKAILYTELLVLNCEQFSFTVM